MVMQLKASRKQEPRPRSTGEGRATGLTILVVLLIAAVAASASLVLTVPQAFDAVATVSADIGARSPGTAGPEKTFHELHSTKAGVEGMDVPTF